MNDMVLFISSNSSGEVTWNACMTACGNGQKAELALDLFDEFRGRGDVSTVTWLTSDSACTTETVPSTLIICPKIKLPF